jgi:hypothetical protein
VGTNEDLPSVKAGRLRLLITTLAFLVLAVSGCLSPRDGDAAATYDGGGAGDGRASPLPRAPLRRFQVESELLLNRMQQVLTDLRIRELERQIAEVEANGGREGDTLPLRKLLDECRAGPSYGPGWMRWQLMSPCSAPDLDPSGPVMRLREQRRLRVIR